MYSFACLVVISLEWIQGLRSKSPGVAGIFHFYVNLLPPLLMCAPILASAAEGVLLSQGHPISLSRGLASVWIALVGSLWVAVRACFRLGKSFPQQKSHGFWGVGAAVAPVILGLVVIVSSLSHLLYVDAQVASVNFSFFRNQVHDMRCDSDMILVRWQEGSEAPAQYRCPKGPVFNVYATAPFVPWPSYRTGESHDLAAALNAMLKDAIRPNSPPK